MNILHHKSWHVRTKKNIDKVRRDEQKALEEQTEKARRADIAEQERRIQQLRSKFNVNQIDKNNEDDRNNQVEPTRSQQKLRSHHKNQPEQETQSSSHINFFEQEYDCSKNKAHELEKKIEQEQWEKKVGILTYLGGNQRNSGIPWYERMPTQNEAISLKEASIIQNSDPLNKIKKDLKKRKESEEEAAKLNEREKFKRNTNRRNRREPERKSRYERSNKTRSASNMASQLNVDAQLSEKELKLIMLRDKRLKREEKEAKKTSDLFAKNLFDICLDDRKRPYYNQFNPHLARR